MISAPSKLKVHQRLHSSAATRQGDPCSVELEAVIGYQNTNEANPVRIDGKENRYPRNLAKIPSIVPSRELVPISLNASVTSEYVSQPITRIEDNETIWNGGEKSQVQVGVPTSNGTGGN